MTKELDVTASAVPGAWRLAICQNTSGYRFALDAFLLADFVPTTVTGPLIDLGTGCGVVALFLARRFPQASIIGLELQSSLAAVAQHNVVRNGLTPQVSIVQGDMRQAQALLPAEAFGAVVCNPPYRAVGSGRLNPQPEKAIARHELTVTLAQVIQAARHLLRRRGVCVLVYHPARLAELCARLEAAGLRPYRMRLIHATLRAPASLVLVEAMRAGREALTVLPPLCVYAAPGVYTAEIQAIFHGRTLPAPSHEEE